MIIADFPQRTATGYALDRLEAVGLAPRESQTLLLIATGKTQRETAQILGCSTSNIKHRVENLFFKLRADRTPELIAKAFASGTLRVLSMMLALHVSVTAPIIDSHNELMPRASRTARNRTRSRSGSARGRRGKTIWLTDDHAIIFA